MNVSAWSIRNPSAAVLLFAILSFAGLMGFRKMAIQQFMDLDLPTVTVVASLAGAAPPQMETEVARKIENAVTTLQGIKHVYTAVQDDTVTMTIEFRMEKPVQEALDEVRDAVARVRSDLPADLRDPVISKLNLSGMPVLTYTVESARMDDEALSWFVDNTVTKAMLSTRGVGAVARVGGVTREIRIELDPAQMLALNATAAEISRQLKRIQQDASGGRADIGGVEESVRTIGTVRSADDLAKMDIVLADGRRLRLDQIATVSDTVGEQRSAALLNGKQVVGFEINRSRGAGEIEVAEAVKGILANLQAEYPYITITEAFNFVDPVIDNYRGSMMLLIEGAALAVLVVWLFLRDWRATFVAATALPLSVMPTFAAMAWMGFSLNIVTLLSLSLVVGVLVDDAIVEIENIMRHLRMGKTPYEAALEAADEIGLAVIATSFTLIAVFLPTAFMVGVSGKFFVQFGWTAAVAVFSSLVVARLLTPMMAAHLLRPPVHGYSTPRWLTVYERRAAWCLNHRRLTMLAAGSVFVSSFALVPLLPTGFMPADDASQTQVHLSLQPGSTFQDSYRVAEQARRIVQAHPHVRLVYATIGGGKAGGDPFALSGVTEVRQITLTLNLTPRRARSGMTKQQIERELRTALTAIPGVQIKIGLGGVGAARYDLVLVSDNGPLLTEHSRTVERELRGIAGIGAVTSTAGLTKPELVIRPDFVRMADAGVTSEAIAETLRIATTGDYDQGLAKLNLAQRQVPIVVKLPPAARTDLAFIERLTVPGKQGPIMLANIASIEMNGGPAEIARYDRQRSVTFEIELNDQPLGVVETAALALPSLRQLPPGITQPPTGDPEAMKELFASFGLAMLTGVLCIYAVLVLLFKDFVQPTTILAALALSVPGAFLALLVTQTALSMPSMIGMIMLMGIATKNSILLVDYALLSRRRCGLSRREALLDACRKRARPIVMTTVAMGAGMLPIALGIGVDPSFRAPMAIVVVGGLITSTVLSLLVIPVVFSYVDDLIDWARRQLNLRSEQRAM